MSQPDSLAASLSSKRCKECGASCPLYRSSGVTGSLSMGPYRRTDDKETSDLGGGQNRIEDETKDARASGKGNFDEGGRHDLASEVCEGSGRKFDTDGSEMREPDVGLGLQDVEKLKPTSEVPHPLLQFWLRDSTTVHAFSHQLSNVPEPFHTHCEALLQAIHMKGGKNHEDAFVDWSCDTFLRQQSMLVCIGFFFDYTSSHRENFENSYFDYSFIFIDIDGIICQYDPLGGPWITDWNIGARNNWELVAGALVENLRPIVH
ncbi:hypothetical protein BJ508DRAFT_348869 [Ascobolus immersus RN42]|uniref:Uncharacterized protein n=1 Tax=Ascobolus immersus RN42 TaxID=1160509 RepID=A0A3N4HYE2_ASCIM|nr:hypothetical protein BJ508DRAFT_348869 [Ascobolus immersus RN42]